MIRCESSYAQIDVDKAVDDLLAKTLSQIKALSANRGIRDIAVWKIEVDEKRLINVRDLADRLNIALIKEGILRELAMDFADVVDRDTLKRLAAIYGINAFIYGKGTTVEGNNVRIAFQVFDINSNEIIWENVVLGVGGLAEAVLAVAGNIMVASTPDKARVLLDGKYRGDTPLTISNLAIGRYKVEVEKERYRTWEKDVVVAEKKTTSVEAVLDPMLASLTVKSNLPETDVFLNGQMVGKTPIMVKDLDLGEYQVRAEKIGQAKEAKVVLEKDRENKELDFKVGGLLSISVDRPLAEIYIDSASRTTVSLFSNTPLLAELTFGDHEVSVKKWGHKDWSRSINLSEDKDKESLKIQLEEETWHWAAKYGSLVGGTISGGVAGYTYFLAQQAANDYKNAGAETPPAKFDEYRNTIRTMNVLTITLGVLSGILIPAGLALLVF
jgi:hypothetical protein